MRYTAFYLFALCGMPAFAAPLKRVVILPFNNLSGDKNFNYLEGSITDAVREKLKQEFLFSEIPPEKIAEFARANYYNPAEYYTDSVPMRLGIELKQDVVIAGGFTAQKGKLTTTVRLFNITDRRVLKKIDYPMEASSSLFESIEKLAVLVALGASAVLPNKSDPTSALPEDEGIALNQAGVYGQYQLAGIPAAYSGTYAQNTTITPKDMQWTIEVGAEYMRHKFLHLKETMLTAKAGYITGNGELSNGIDSRNVKLSQHGGVLLLGMGYRFMFKHNLFLMPGAAGGYYLARTTFDYSGLSVPATSSGGGVKTDSAVNASSPIAELQLRFGIDLNSRMLIEIASVLRSHFYTDTTPLYVNTGIAFAFRI